jgi:large subunit ribosomal protein L23
VKDPHDVIIRPVVSEKSFVQSEANNAYTFIVASSASKPEISDAIETIFDGVKVAKVNTLNRKGKRVRNRRNNTVSTRPTTKRAIVTLAEGEIELYSS